MGKQPPPQPEMSVAEKFELVRSLMFLVALTAMVFLRRDLGYRFLNPLHLFAMTIFLMVVAAFADQTPNPQALNWFAFFMLAFGLAQRCKRWNEMRRGRVLHSFFIGHSLFDAKGTPKFLRRHPRLLRFMDSLVCVLAGLAVRDYSPVLGLWLIFSGLALRVLDDTVYRREKNLDLDLVDSLVVSQNQGDVVEHYEDSATPPPGQSQPGLPTGLSADLQAHIQRRPASRNSRRP